jgi:hypothetical protein
LTTGKEKDIAFRWKNGRLPQPIVSKNRQCPTLWYRFLSAIVKRILAAGPLCRARRHARHPGSPEHRKARPTAALGRTGRRALSMGNLINWIND